MPKAYENAVLRQIIAASHAAGVFSEEDRWQVECPCGEAMSTCDFEQELCIEMSKAKYKVETEALHRLLDVPDLASRGQTEWRKVE